MELSRQHFTLVAPVVAVASLRTMAVAATVFEEPTPFWRMRILPVARVEITTAVEVKIDRFLIIITIGD
jgi:hypothetical protein